MNQCKNLVKNKQYKVNAAESSVSLMSASFCIF